MPPRLRSSSGLRRSFPLLALCIVQSCERFAFFVMLPPFIFYLRHRHGMSEPHALLVLGLFQALSYVGGLPAGWLADKKLGAAGAAVFGSGLLMLGYGCLAVDRPTLLWPALGLMALGHSFFKPSLHVLISRLSGESEVARERGFLWHYLAINIGCLVGPTCSEWLHARHGWPVLFGSAAAAMGAGAGVLAIGCPLMCVEFRQRRTPHPSAQEQPAPGSMQAVWLICGVATVFWLTVQQAAGSLMLFAAENTVLYGNVVDRAVTLGPGHFSSLHALMVLVLLPVFLSLNARRHASAPGSTPGRMIWGYLTVAAAFALLSAAGLIGADIGRVSPAWLVGCYALLSVAEMLLAPLGISLLTLLAPKDRAGQAVGLWFVAMAAGNVLAGLGGLLWTRWPHHRYFALLAALSLFAALLLRIRLRALDQLILRRSVAALRPSEAVHPSVEADDGAVQHDVPALGRTGPWLAGLAILLPAVLSAVQQLPLPIRAVSAICCGVLLLVCGSYLMACAIESMNPSSIRRREASAL